MFGGKLVVCAMWTGLLSYRLFSTQEYMQVCRGHLIAMKGQIHVTYLSDLMVHLRSR